MHIALNKLSMVKLAFSLSVLLMISGCSDKTATDTPAVDAAETTVVEVPVVVEAVEETTEVIQPPASTANTVEPELLAIDAGAKLYESNCKVCHTSGLLNAPKLSDKQAWVARIAKGKETLYRHSAQGFNKMPAQAVNGITEAQVRAAVDYMLVDVS